MNREELAARIEHGIEQDKRAYLAQFCFEVSDWREVVAALRDSGRYQWLRGQLFAMDGDYCAPDGVGVVFKFPADARIGTNGALDAAIDAARSALKEGGT